MRTLVIGGMQFMGRGVVESLVRGGHDVAVMHRRDHHDLGPEVRNLLADRGDLDTVAAILRRERPEVVFDFAYSPSGTPAEHVESAARSCGDRLHRYVFISSMAAYVPGPDRREDDPLVPDDHPEDYSRHKASAERALLRMHAASGFPVVTVRPPFVHGPRQPFYREQFFWDRLRDGRPIVLPDGGGTRMQWVYVTDVVELCLRVVAMAEAVGEAFNVAHAERTTQRTFVEALAAAAGVEPRFVPVPRAAIGSAGGRLFGEPLYFGEFLDLFPISQTVEKARRLLGFTPTPLETALAAGHAWYLTQPRRPVDYAFEDRLIASA
jgi:nucleoside-diphosphate-sugar epimerase